MTLPYGYNLKWILKASWTKSCELQVFYLQQRSLESVKFRIIIEECSVFTAIYFQRSSENNNYFSFLKWWHYWFLSNLDFLFMFFLLFQYKSCEPLSLSFYCRKLQTSESAPGAASPWLQCWMAWFSRVSLQWKI